MRGAALVALLAMPAAFAACNGGGGTASVHGTVENDDTGARLSSASVAIGGAQGTTGSDGKFTLSVSDGEQALDVVRAGFHELHTRVRLSQGDNDLKLRLVPCAPVDPSCPPVTPTPTPSPTGPTPLPTPLNANVTAAFDGVNVPTLAGQPGEYPAWTGFATLKGPSSPTGRNVGDNNPTNGFDDSYSECWDDAAGNDPMVMGDPRTAIDECWFVFFGFNDAVSPQSFGPDSAFVVTVSDYLLWEDESILSIGPGVRAEYFEGTMQPNGEMNVNALATKLATEGIFRLQRSGFFASQPVTMTTGAFLVPNLP